jgi:uncharacterized protein (TIGR00369 family)
VLDMIKAQMGSSVPFAGFTGIELVELSPQRGVARLTQRHEVSNHVGSMHAGAVFTLAEAASGAAMAGVFADQILSIRPVVSDARISYAKSARGVITATAIAAVPADELQGQLTRDGRAIFDVQVELADESGTVVATFVATWNVKKV